MPVVGKWIFDSNIMFELPLTCDDMNYYYTSNNDKTGTNKYKKIEINLPLFNRENSFFVPNWKNTEITFDVIKIIWREANKIF